MHHDKQIAFETRTITNENLDRMQEMIESSGQQSNFYAT